MPTIILISILIQAASGYLFGPSKVTGALGGSVMVSCYYNPISANIYGRKFWCKMSKDDCFTIISTKNYINQNYINRTNLQKYTDHFKINMTNLQQKDNGIYRCGIGNNNGRFYYTVNVTVSEGNKIPYSSEVIIANLKSSITINCPVIQEQGTGWKYWCKMHHQMDVPSCHTMVNSSGYVHENFWGRVLIQEVYNTSDFKILVNNIKMNDFGFYRCGTGKFEDGSDWTDIHIHILNPSETIRYRIIKPRSRSPGELAVAQCQVPKSFHTVFLVYWCRWNETGCLRLIDSNGFIQKGFQNRVSLNNTNRTYIMSLAQLELGDSGYYWCVITDGQNMQTSSVEVHVIAPTTTEIYLSSISRHTRGNSLTATTYSTDRPSATDFYAENTTRQQFITTARHHTGGASIVPLTADPTPPTNSIQESTSTTSKNSVTGNIAEYTRAFLPTNTDTSLTHSTTIKQETTKELYTRTSGRWHNRSKVYTPFIPILTTSTYQESHINITPSPSSLKTLTATLNLSHNVLTTKGSKSSTEQDFCADNTTWHQFITTARDQTGGASVPTLATNSIQGMDYSGNITPHSTHTMSETEENYGISHGYKLNSEVTILLENSTVETQSKPGHNGSRYQSQNPKNLILILFPVLAISCVIGFATLIYVVKNVRKKREATDNSVHHQENLFMRDREPAKEEISEESEILTHELAKYNNVFKETEV
ncbi:polymeric immunoglobulin receptor-like isoform X2 [Hyla sarda]|uniref:polymeric immunoglobulin receptor-like isoform X2 n=1 Tax=Hyla sarda TaxID=327740 RepID=UPI0024C40292|nr:polymeric immunoglobulin receptor-like isoform X2 [Hyla sarda]